MAWRGTHTTAQVHSSGHESVAFLELPAAPFVFSELHDLRSADAHIGLGIGLLCALVAVVLVVTYVIVAVIFRPSAEGVFTVKLQKSSLSESLGLVCHQPDEGKDFFEVDSIMEGVAKTYNMGAPIEKQIIPGDRIIAVNDVRKSKAMAKIMKESLNVTLVVERCQSVRKLVAAPEELGKGSGKGTGKGIFSLEPETLEKDEGGYTWSQKGDEVQILFKLPRSIAKKGVKVAFKISSLKVEVEGASLFNGSLAGKIDTDECFWCLACGGTELQVMLTKQNAMENWPGLLK
jgi:hypothetical protein